MLIDLHMEHRSFKFYQISLLTYQEKERINSLHFKIFQKEVYITIKPLQQK